MLRQTHYFTSNMLRRKLAVLIAFFISSLMGHANVEDPISQRLEKIYASKSNEEIRALLLSWGSFSPFERRFLLAETGGRVKEDKRKSVIKNHWINIRVERRYGSSVNSADGNRFTIRNRNEKRAVGNTDISATLSKFENPLQNRVNILSVISRSQNFANKGGLELSPVTSGLGFGRRKVNKDSSRTDGHRRLQEVLDRQKKIQ